MILRDALLERRIRDLQARLLHVRNELALLDEQISTVCDGAEEARVRALVAETPLSTHEYEQARRHAEAMQRARGALSATQEDLIRRRDDLLCRIGTRSR